MICLHETIFLIILYHYFQFQSVFTPEVIIFLDLWLWLQTPMPLSQLKRHKKSVTKCSIFDQWHWKTLINKINGTLNPHVQTTFPLPSTSLVVILLTLPSTLGSDSTTRDKHFMARVLTATAVSRNTFNICTNKTTHHTWRSTQVYF